MKVRYAAGYAVGAYGKSLLGHIDRTGGASVPLQTLVEDIPRIFGNLERERFDYRTLGHLHDVLIIGQLQRERVAGVGCESNQRLRSELRLQRGGQHRYLQLIAGIDYRRAGDIAGVFAAIRQCGLVAPLHLHHVGSLARFSPSDGAGDGVESELAVKTLPVGSGKHYALQALALGSKVGTGSVDIESQQ